MEGAWNWVSDTKVQYRTKEYWPARTEVSVTADLAGVQAGADVWGDQDKQVDFQIGKSVVSVVDVTAHQMTVTIDGEVARTIPVTTGKDGFLTRGGTRVISEKLEDIRMDAASTGITPGDPEYYNLDVRYALRMTNSGEFIHAAPWSVASQGVANVSHGCVGMSTANARWLFQQSHVGDVVTIVHSTRKLEPGNGLTQWNVLLGGLAGRLGVLSASPTITAQSLRSGVQRERLRAGPPGPQNGQPVGLRPQPRPRDRPPHGRPRPLPSPGLHTAAGLGVSVDSVSGGAGARRRWARFAVMAPPAVASAGSPIPPDALTAELRGA